MLLDKVSCIMYWNEVLVFVMYLTIRSSKDDLFSYAAETLVDCPELDLPELEKFR